MHYQRARKHGEPEVYIPQMGCKVKGCTKPHHAKGYCHPHYRRNKDHGDPQADIPVKQPKGPISRRVYAKANENAYAKDWNEVKERARLLAW